MNKNIVLLLLIIAIVVGVLWWQSASAPRTIDNGNGDVDQEEGLPGEEAAEMTGFGFMQDLIKAAPGEDDAAAAERLYAALSARAKTEVAEDTILRDIALFVGVQDVPDQGVSVENLEVHSDTETTLIIGLNYSGGRVLRAIDMVVEDGEWKVDAIRSLDTYPPEDEVVTPPENGANGETGAIARDGCYIGGCSAQVCSDDPDVITTCEWLEEYACYRNATCERQADGECGWTQSDALVECVASARASDSY